jgi:hypothetical protein
VPNSPQDTVIIVSERSVYSGALVGGPTGPTGATGPGLPTGGTANQVLTKINSTDYNTQWSNLSQSSLTGVGITLWAPSTSYTKGDLVNYLGVAYRRISTGTSGTVFDASDWHRQQPIQSIYSGAFVPGNYYMPHWYGAATAATNASVNVLATSVIVVPNTSTITSISIDLTAAAAAGGVARLGIYNSTNTGTPNNLVVDAGTVSTTTTGVKELILSQSLDPGVYYLACVFQNNVTGLIYRYISSVSPYYYQSSNFPSSTAIPNSFVAGSISGSLPSTFPTPSAGYAPKIWIKT